MVLVSTLWTCGSSHLYMRQPQKTEWRSVHFCSATAPTPPCSTATTRAPSIWPRPPCWKSAWRVSTWLLQRPSLIFSGSDGVPLFVADEFRGHSLLQAAREADMARFKKHLSLETINFKHPLTQETALVRTAFSLLLNVIFVLVHK